MLIGSFQIHCGAVQRQSLNKCPKTSGHLSFLNIDTQTRFKKKKKPPQKTQNCNKKHQTSQMTAKHSLVLSHVVL